MFRTVGNTAYTKLNLGVAEDIEMNHAKLIKREEWLQQKHFARQQTRLAAAAAPVTDTIIDWVKRQQATPKPNSRARFAALFVEPPAESLKTQT